MSEVTTTLSKSGELRSVLASAAEGPVRIELSRPLERKEFALHYQPIIDLWTGLITGAEALIR